MDKRELRAKMRALRRAMPPLKAAADSRALAERLFALPVYRNAKSVYLYLSLPGEVDTEPILERALADGKRVAAPKVQGREMAFYWLDADAVYEIGPMGIREPMDTDPADDEAALVIVPALAFSPAGFRYGYHTFF